MTLSATSSPITARAGIGLRFPHHAASARGEVSAAWLEVHAENYMADAAALCELHAVRAQYPLSIHAVGLSLGSAAGIDEAHLQRLRELVCQLNPALVSDHLSWSTVPGVFLPDLLPLPYTEEALEVMCRNVDRVQQTLGRQLLVENPSTYLRYADACLSESQFMAALARRTGCGVLLDVNNIYVSACNHGDSAQQMLDAYLRELRSDDIGELHLAGHTMLRAADGVSLRIDDHGSAVDGEVWNLYRRALRQIGPRPTLIEWDTRIPAFAVLQREAQQAQSYLDACRTDYALAV